MSHGRRVTERAGRCRSYDIMKKLTAVGSVILLLAAFVIKAFAIAGKGGPQIGEVPPPLTLPMTLQGRPAADLSWVMILGCRAFRAISRSFKRSLPARCAQPLDWKWGQIAK